VRKGLQPAVGHGATSQQEQVRLPGQPVFVRRQRQCSAIAVPVSFTDVERGRCHDGDDAPGNPGSRLKQSGDFSSQHHRLNSEVTNLTQGSFFQWFQSCDHRYPSNIWIGSSFSLLSFPPRE